jgi:hypothetical protein
MAMPVVSFFAHGFGSLAFFAGVASEKKLEASRDRSACGLQHLDIRMNIHSGLYEGPCVYHAGTED